MRGRALLRQVSELETEANQSDLARKRLAKDWTKLASCFGKAINYLSDHFSVLSREYLGYDYIVSMLALFYFWNGLGPSEQQKLEIKKWFWATCVGQRYSGGEFLRCIRADTKFLKNLALKDGTQFFHYKPLKDLSHLKGTQYSGRTGIGCAVYCLLLRHHPVSMLEDGLNAISLARYAAPANRKDRHHIFPRGVMRAVEEAPSRYNSIANICLLTTEENKQIGSKRPRMYLEDVQANTGYFRKKMDHHLIPCDDQSGVWFRDVKRGFSRFINQRAALIRQALEREAGIRLFRRDK